MGEQFADGVLDDVVDDVGGGVIDAAGFFDFGFVFDFGAVGFGEGDDFAEELFIDLAEDVGGEDGEFVGGVGVVEVFEDVFEGFVVDGEGVGEGVGGVGAVFFGLEVEEAGVVAFVGAVVEGEESFIDVGAVEEGLELGVGFDGAVFADAEEDEAVDGALDGEVEPAVGEVGVAEGEVAGEGVAPGFDFGEEGGIDFGGAFFLFGGLGVFVEGTLEDGFFGEDVGDFGPAVGVFGVFEVLDAGGGGFVVFVGFGAGVVNGEFFEVGEDGEGQFGRPGVAAELEGGGDVGFEVDGGFFLLRGRTCGRRRCGSSSRELWWRSRF